MERYNDAFATYDKAIAHDTSRPESYWVKGTLLWQLRRYDEAMLACGAAIERAPHYKEQLRFLTIKQPENSI